MKRELSRVSRITSRAEEEGRASEEAFDLDQFLQSMSYQDKEFGKKPKHLGLIWKDLEVEVVYSSLNMSHLRKSSTKR